MAGLSLVTAPTLMPVSGPELKNWARITEDVEDVLIEQLITAVCKRFQEKTGQLLLTQTWDLFLDAFPLWPEPWIEIPRAPVLSVTSVKYTQSDGTPVTIASTDYYVDLMARLPRIYPLAAKPWPSTSLRPANGVEVRFVGGYGPSLEDVTDDVRQSLREMIASGYENREGGIDNPVLDAQLAAHHTRPWA